MANTQVKKTTAFLSVVAMVLSMLLYFPGGTFSTYSGLKASAEGVTFTATVGTAGVAADGSEGYASLIDGKYSSTDTSDYSKWCVTNFSSAYIIFSASEPILVTGYSIVTGNDNKTFTGRNPKSWTLYGCNDAIANSEEGKDTTSWKVIDAVTDDEQLEDENYTKYVYDKLTGSTSTKYQYFKLEITATQGSDVMQMSEFILTHCVHEWEISDTIDPTCIKGGYDVNECSICHWQKKVPTAEAWGHDFGEDGLCTRCGVEDTTPKEPSVVNNVYQIGTAGELYWFAYKVNNDNSNFGSARAVLTADITVNSNLLGSMTFDAYGNVSNGTRFTSWTPIGNSVFNAYSGTFDGQNYTIRGLYFNDSTVNDVSLFGYNNGTVKNVSVVDSYFKGYKNVGGVCGFNGGTITSCYNTGTVSGTSCVGGVCGWNATKCTITSCYNTGAVSGTSDVGGVCGFNDGTITSCYNTGTVSGTETIGGVCGYNYDYSTITNCYNTGTVSGTETIGGVCGYNFGGTITNCYNTGAVSGTKEVGGVCGFICYRIANCYFDSDKYSGNAIGSSLGGTATDVEGKATVQFNRGEVAYRLSQGYTVGSDTYDGSVWGQTIGTDNYPVLGGKKVYATTGCVTYNNDGNTNAKEHNYTFTADAHSCSDCGFTESHSLGENNQCTVCKTYAIANADQLYWFADQVKNNHTSFKNANAVLTADITVNTGVLQSDGTLADDTSSFRSWTPIGYSDLRIYTGIFDGQGHTISGLYVNDASARFVGLFGCAGTSSSVSNVGVVDSYFNGNNNVGGVCGYSNGKITNCYNQATVNGSGYVGGVCGEAGPGSTSKITNCYNVGIVKGKTYTACVVGYADSGKVSNCYYSGEQPEEDLPILTQPVIPIDPSITLTTTTTKPKITVPRLTTTTTTTTTREMPGIVIPSLTTTSTSTQTPTVPTQATTDGLATPKTPEQFASGEVAYLLAEGDNGSVWGQKIGTDAYPVLDGTKKVYQIDVYAGCKGNPGTASKGYSNTNAPVYAVHNMTEHPANAASCTNSGNYAYWTCSHENGVYYKDEAGTETFADFAATVIPAHGHDMTEHPANAATCTNPGNYSYWTCSCEDCIYYKDAAGTDTFENLAATVIPAHGHDMTEHPANAASCTNSGNYAYWTCSREDGVYYKDEAGTDTFENLEATVIPASEHDYTSAGICKICAALENGKDGFKSVSLTMTDGVILNYHLLLSEEALADVDAFIHFTSPQGLDVIIKLSEGVQVAGKYKFSLELRPDQMAEVITAQVVYSDGSTGNSVNYSVQQYGENVTEADSSKALVDAMLKYGAYTQLYTGENTDNLAVPVGDYTVNASIGESYQYQLDGSVSGVTLTAATLQIGAYTTIRLKYQLEDGADIQDYTFKCGDTVLTPEKSGDFYYIYLRNIRPQDLDEMYSVTVSDGTNTTTFAYSAFTYMKNVLDNAESYDQTLVNVINAMYDYHQTAEAYLIG